MLKDMTFFGETGLTSTSANHVSNLAKEYIAYKEQILEAMKFLNVEISLIGTDTKHLLEKGNTDKDLENIPSLLEDISQAKSLYAWFREALKAKENLLKEAHNLTFEKWAKDNNITIPELPQFQEEDVVKELPISIEDAMGTLSVGERNKLFELQAKASVYGKFIHPDGPYAKARKELFSRISKSIEISGSGAGTRLHYYTPTITTDKEEEIFFKLQAEHRKVQAEYNGIMHKLAEMVDADASSKADKYAAEQEAYNARYEVFSVEYQSVSNQLAELKAQHRKAKLALQAQVNRLKIIIPHSLQDIYQKVNSLGK